MPEVSEGCSLLHEPVAYRLPLRRITGKESAGKEPHEGGESSKDTGNVGSDSTSQRRPTAGYIWAYPPGHVSLSGLPEIGIAPSLATAIGLLALCERPRAEIAHPGDILLVRRSVRPDADDQQVEPRLDLRQFDLAELAFNVQQFEVTRTARVVDVANHLVRSREGVDAFLLGRLGEYDRSEPLVIDPVLAYSSLLGGNDVDLGNGIAADASGNVYVSGYFTGVATWDGGANPDVTITTRSDFDGFLAKYSPIGDLAWVQQIGGTDQDVARGVVGPVRAGRHAARGGCDRSDHDVERHASNESFHRIDDLIRQRRIR